MDYYFWVLQHIASDKAFTWVKGDPLFAQVGQYRVFRSVWKRRVFVTGSRTREVSQIAACECGGEARPPDALRGHNGIRLTRRATNIPPRLDALSRSRLQFFLV